MSPHATRHPLRLGRSSLPSFPLPPHPARPNLGPRPSGPRACGLRRILPALLLLVAGCTPTGPRRALLTGPVDPPSLPISTTPQFDGPHWGQIQFATTDSSGHVFAPACSLFIASGLVTGTWNGPLGWPDAFGIPFAPALVDTVRPRNSTLGYPYSIHVQLHLATDSDYIFDLNLYTDDGPLVMGYGDSFVSINGQRFQAYPYLDNRPDSLSAAR